MKVLKEHKALTYVYFVLSITPLKFVPYRHNGSKERNCVQGIRSINGTAAVVVLSPPEKLL